jgi:hypothetical protein
MYMLNHDQHINRNKAIKITGFERATVCFEQTFARASSKKTFARALSLKIRKKNTKILNFLVLRTHRYFDFKMIF